MADSNGKLGGLIMLIGIIVQLVFFTIFLVLATEYLLRYVKDRPFQRRKYAGIPDEERTEWNLKLKRLWVAMAIIAGCLIIRGIYRIIELADGFDGRVIKTQIYFIIFDGAMVLVAMLTLNVFHPGRMLQPTQSPLPLEYITLESGGTRFNSSSKV
ncbi:hypothetical protein QCA50_005754 [Cerrena zonata]|uniref:Uncharacterized protein n=1 Tax=Cerrena zonata TaxID=2478898 RepID=A0AAW0GNB6_9APHY